MRRLARAAGGKSEYCAQAVSGSGLSETQDVYQEVPGAIGPKGSPIAVDTTILPRCRRDIDRLHVLGGGLRLRRRCRRRGGLTSGVPIEALLNSIPD